MDSYYRQHHIVKTLKQTKLAFGDVKPKKRKRKAITEEKRADNKTISTMIKRNVYMGQDRKEAISSAYKSLRKQKDREKKTKELKTQPRINKFFKKV